MQGIFDELLRNIRYEESPNDDDMRKMLRLDAAKWACILGNAECKRIAAAKLNEHLANPTNHQ